MLIAFDIGNTNIVIGCFDGPKLVGEFRIKTETGRTQDEYCAVIVALLNQHFGPKWKFSSAIISSVVPPLTADISNFIETRLGPTPHIIGPGTKSGLPIKLADPGAIGADRIVNAVAVKHYYGTPALVIDFGTATSFDFVNQSGAYEGGIIAPGLGTSAESLVRNTAKLPRFELTWPAAIIGKNTVAAMQSGTVVGYICMIDGLIELVLEEVGDIQHIVSTGGLARLIAKHSKRIKIFDPDLNLRGLELLARMNA